MAVDQAIRERIAADLWNAEQSATAIDRPTDSHPDLDVVDAYEIQLLNIGKRLADGAKISGHKVGLASEAMQKMMGVDEPDYGHLLDEMQYFEHTPIDTGKLCFPRVEVEVGFILGEDLPGEGCTNQDVIDATAWVVPSIELIDSRIKDWKITLCDTIADNASSCGWILGQQRVPIDEIDTGDVDAVLHRNGEIVAKGNSSAVLGHPLNAVSWLARKVEGFGVRLRKGDLILPGTATRAIDISPGDHFVADFAGLGSVTLDFT
ncbi:fumarylacetoacetate hydrolase family protein [Gordonia sp. zg691]|uniref:Fumarylacetoacetate hydrolase family protein n=1 Tax=Gordonia jinghuaiqii TaxID=2758710 RepID=A0A7D7R3Y0_9ACTN|nr:2-keto-4-pentenoate hydratase [Gordonia jinghuaiqii]MBD0861770.1 fumarylacetoacetate hydrolase family protein [Gordonia jinghuaiqii]MCR5977663.1 2-keto-4-pentenoate hydratase [Gordonia jinghuaiqii]QMT02332.1 fumarylacetoacetate hydrolase family protein [Gordonia jinghuaiqii]